MFKKIMMWILGVVAVFVGLMLVIGISISEPGYDGKTSANFDGKKFINEGNVSSKTLWDVLKWQLSNEPGEWRVITEEEAPYGVKPVEINPDSSVIITYINHATFLLQTEGKNILTDPVYSYRVSPFSFAGPHRMRPPGIRFEDLPEIHAIVISHNHYDHLDVSTLKKIRDLHNPVILVPLGVNLMLEKEGFDNVVSLNWWDDYQLSEEIKISSTQAQHFSARGMFDRDRTLWSGYAIQNSSGTSYFAGDTGYGPFFKKIAEKYAPINVALIPIGAYMPRWFMGPMHVDPEQAIQIHKDVQAKQSFGMHFGTFPLADDGQLDPIQDLEKVVGDEKFSLIKEGDSVIID